MEKINQLIRNWPKGAVYTSVYLKSRGFSKQLIDRYKKSHWLETIGKGAYIPEGMEVDWYGGLYAIQKQLNMPIHVGGKTALALKGRVHYLAKKITKLFLFGQTGVRLPTWFREFNLEFYS